MGEPATKKHRLSEGPSLEKHTVRSTHKKIDWNALFLNLQYKK